MTKVCKIQKFALILMLWAFCVNVIVAKIGSWCDPELCPNGKVHTACNNDGVNI